MHTTAPMKAPGTLYCIAKGALAAASLQLVGPSPCKKIRPRLAVIQSHANVIQPFW